ncbi:RING finger and CHY zinc finger domain-containing 1 [Paramuricea clavata]|nr:RING finger and CHY zinc finger domain-containing 1 [Paramuricea clavata]
MDPEKAKANFSRVCALLVDKGRDALKAALHMVHPPSTLAAVLNANKSTLKKIRNSVINASQWNLLFPVSGTPDSNNFDITLLTILLRNICGLASPAAGSDNRPPASDTSISANILRIKIFRNEVYGHIANPKYDDTTFETLWQEIAKPLVKLGIPQQYIDELKTVRVSFKEECYIETIKEWTELEDKRFSVNFKINDSVLPKTFENGNPSQVNQLTKFDFTRKIDDLSKKFHGGTRHWYFEQVSSWFSKEYSTVMIMTADIGVGMSVMSARFCKLYEQCGKLAAYHFCDFRNEDYSNPKRILQSLASQMCDNVDGFHEKLTEVLRHEHSQDSLSDAFRVLLNDPLHALERREPMLIVVDALDDSKTDVKSEFLEMIFEEFLELPNWVKVLVWSKAGFNARKKLLHLPAELLPRIWLLNAVNRCSQHADEESKMFHPFDQQSSKAANRNLDNDFALDSKPIRTSEEGFQLDLEDEKASHLSPDFEINVKNLETKTTKENEKCSRLVNVSSQTSVNPSGKFQDGLMHLPLKRKSKSKQDFENNSTTQMQDCVSSNEDSSTGEIWNKGKRNKIKSNKKPEREISEDSNMIDHVLPQQNEWKKGKGIDGYIKYPGTERKKKSDEMLKSLENEDNSLKSRSLIHFPRPPALTLSRRVKELEEENAFLKNEMKSLRAKYEDTLAELGRIDVQKTAKENEERKSELFQQIFRFPLSEATVLPTSKDRPINDMHGSPNRFLKPHPTNEKVHTLSDIYPATFAEHHVEGAGALVQRSNLQPRKEETVTSHKGESEIQRGDRRGNEVSTFMNNNENQTPSSQNSSSNNTSREKTSGGDGINPSGKVQGASGLESTYPQSYENLSLSVQQDDSGTEYISLGNVPPTSVATTLYNNYKLLLLSLGQRLLSSDVVKLKNWASQNFSINDPQNVTDILFQLDQKAVINASDLSQLSLFFESIVRIDLVYIIDSFLLGDYNKLRQTSAPKQGAANAAQTSTYRSTTMYQSMFDAMNTARQSLVNPGASGTLKARSVRNSATLSQPGNGNGPQRSLPQQTQPPGFRNLSDTANPACFPRSPNENQSTASEQQSLKPVTTGFTANRMADVVVADGSGVTNERRTMAGNSLTRTNPSVTNNTRTAHVVESNGSKFQRPEAERSNSSNFQSPGGSRNQYLDREDNWLCSHYKRHCYVKFECCNSFWPCHRCHNNQSTCGRKKLKSRDTQMLKCVYCSKVQQFGHSCCDCGAKFSAYYCGLCKHLTGKDDNPYHCVKCGICRIHGDRSFHCDVCGVCLDVQLRGNHKCREGSAHDECCICLEDAFTGCQILPCSHKVHKECATQMIRSGM